MKLVKPIKATKSSKRVGRGPGSGLGGTAGRGHKGAGQRSGFKHRYWFDFICTVASGYCKSGGNFIKVHHW